VIGREQCKRNAQSSSGILVKQLEKFAPFNEMEKSRAKCAMPMARAAWNAARTESYPRIHFHGNLDYTMGAFRGRLASVFHYYIGDRNLNTSTADSGAPWIRFSTGFRRIFDSVSADLRFGFDASSTDFPCDAPSTHLRFDFGAHWFRFRRICDAPWIRFRFFLDSTPTHLRSDFDAP